MTTDLPAGRLAAGAGTLAVEPTVARRIVGLALRSPWFRFGAALFALLVVPALLLGPAGVLDATTMDVAHRLHPPVGFEGGSAAHWLGTDQLGRDLLARSLAGMQYSLLIGVGATVLTFAVGCGAGLVAGFKSGWPDLLLMRLADAQLSIPAIVLAVTVLGVCRPSVGLIVLVLALANWPGYARMARSVALAERHREDVLASRGFGATDLRIVLTLVAPVVLPPLAFVAVLDVARMMIFEALLAFIGLGLQPPLPSFGNIIADGRKYLINAWWVATLPGGLLVLLLLSLNMMGTALERARNRVLGGLA
jgi:peptide/nickel transport system permease protein